MRNGRGDGIVYSTEFGKMCAKCGKAITVCICRNASTEQKSDGIVRILRERKGRKGKGVTIIRGIPLPLQELTIFAKKLKQSCGSGGTVKSGIIEIQGDHCDQLMEVLKKEGWVVRRSGG